MYSEWNNVVNYVIQDRVFWIYFIVALFFVIIGAAFILTSDDYYMILLWVFWLLTTVILVIMTYNTALSYAPTDINRRSDICILDPDAKCLAPYNRSWLLVNIIFVILLVLSVLWAAEIANKQIAGLTGVLILLFGITLATFTISKDYMNPSFWLSIFYLAIWFSLTLYVSINS